MDALPPPVSAAFPSPSTTSPPPALPFLVGSSAPPSIPCHHSIAPILAGDGQPEARPETAARKLGFDGGQEIDGDEPQPGKDGGSDPQLCIDAGGQKRPQCKNNERRKPNKSPIIPTIIKESQMQLGEGKLHMGKTRPDYHNEPRKPRSEKSKNSKGDLPMGSKSASPRLRSPIQVTSSPGVNMLARSVAVKRVSVIERSGSIKRAKGSHETSQHPPSFTQLSSPSLEDLSPGTRATSSHASKRRRRKLISAIWREAEPIYKEGKLVEGRCIHCHQIFAASRDSGTSHIKRHLKAVSAQCF